MSQFLEAYNAIIQEAVTATALVSPALPLARDNASFRKPANAGPYAAAQVNYDDTEVQSLRGDRVRYKSEGTLTISVFRQQDKGDGLQRSWVETIANHFRRRVLNPTSTLVLRFRRAAQVRVGEQGAYWRMNLQLPYEMEDTEERVEAAVGGGQPTPDEAASIIRQRFAEQVATPESLPVQFDNRQADKPEPSIKTPKAFGVWSVRHGEEVQDFGTYQRVAGVATFNIYWPAKAGMERPLQLADTCVSAFRAVTDRGVSFQSPSLSRGGLLDPWFQLNVRCPYYFEFVA